MKKVIGAYNYITLLTTSTHANDCILIWLDLQHVMVRDLCTHRRMGTLWLGGAEGLIAQNFTQITGADTGFPGGAPRFQGGDFTSTPPPLGHCLRDVIRPPEN